jgi:alpha-galactosidase/6-phospho-beta-glucosidase family protein
MTLKDLMDTPEMHGCEVILVDIDEGKVNRMLRLANR